MGKRRRSQDQEEDGDRREKRSRGHSRKNPLEDRTELAAVEAPDATPRARTVSTENRFLSLGCAVKSEAKSEECRRWTYSSRDFSSFKERIVFVSYNILGVKNAEKHQDLYCNVRPEFLKWRRRKRLIRREIKGYNASIICFQEVDCFDDLAILLRKYGFTGIYKARTGEANDGCAMFWKDEQFTIVHQENLEFKTFDLRDNVAQLCVLKMNQIDSETMPQSARTSKHYGTRYLLVGNIHVLFNPSRGDIKLGQIRLLLEKARKLSQKWGDIPAIFGGDLNSVPQSAIYQFLASSELDVRLHHRKDICKKIEDTSYSRVIRHYRTSTSGFHCAATPRRFYWSSEELRLATGHERISHIRHTWKLFSAYMGIPGSSRTRDDFGEPLVTSYHSKFMGTVDYIWHTEGLVPVRVLETLPVNILRRLGGLPSEKWGSDHLALVCELALVD
ncbi:hypothetical protein MLD38_026217 [Melastoma candidum]|uniref:Uncharacterized protein n=1 Tax=Melastoma candidum TaxID=119954 RepID=A0ACB9NXX1_9MYRT|nr:hypothetical protein MLD38_026217 [Melastoma candidum]